GAGPPRDRLRQQPQHLLPGHALRPGNARAGPAAETDGGRLRIPRVVLPGRLRAPAARPAGRLLLARAAVGPAPGVAAGVVLVRHRLPQFRAAQAAAAEPGPAAARPDRGPALRATVPVPRIKARQVPN